MHPGRTGLVLQCFTGRGEGLGSSAYGDVVAKAVDYLMKTAAAKPQGMLATDIKISGSTYAHSLATKALGEVYLLAKAGQKMPPRLEATFRKAVDLIIKSQNPRASWCYGGEMAGQPAAYNPTSEGGEPPPRELSDPGSGYGKGGRLINAGYRCLHEKSRRLPGVQAVEGWWV